MNKDPIIVARQIKVFLVAAVFPSFLPGTDKKVGLVGSWAIKQKGLTDLPVLVISDELCLASLSGHL